MTHSNNVVRQWSTIPHISELKNKIAVWLCYTVNDSTNRIGLGSSNIKIKHTKLNSLPRKNGPSSNLCRAFSKWSKAGPDAIY